MTAKPSLPAATSPTADHDQAGRARQALERARTDPGIRAAIADAPPLDPDTLDRLRALVPPPAAT